MWGKLRFISPLRCLDCNKRFIGPTVVWKDLLFARCPICLRMDLNAWTGKTYRNPPFFIALRVALGARKWRCEYCRYNFASFRKRKEIFTFSRWAKFTPEPEQPAHNGNGAPQEKSSSGQTAQAREENA